MIFAPVDYHTVRVANLNVAVVVLVMEEYPNAERDVLPLEKELDQKKKGLLLFDYACHPCKGTMLIFCAYLSVCLVSQPKGQLKKKINIQEACHKS